MLGFMPAEYGARRPGVDQRIDESCSVSSSVMPPGSPVVGTAVMGNANRRYGWPDDRERHAGGFQASQASPWFCSRGRRTG